MNPFVREFLKDLSQDNLNEKVLILLSTIKNNYVDSNQTTIMFALHNMIFINNQEHGISCASCRGRVFNRLTTWSNENNQEKKDI